MVGRVECVVPSENYGIITDEQRQQFVFFRSGVADGQFDGLAAHEAVIFEPRDTAYGGLAVTVRSTGGRISEEAKYHNHP
jgi:hypothetical protein